MQEKPTVVAKPAKQHKFSETFMSFQGEGSYTGRLTVWIRFFLCPLQCDGFGQADPTDPSTYVLPYQDFNLDNIEAIEDLPVFSYGCDSSYSWSAKYKHLQKSGTAREIADRLTGLLPGGKFKHPVTGADIHWAVTGGEPLMKHSQVAFLEIMQEFERDGNMPMFITFETNGTQPLTPAFIEWAHYYKELGGELFFSVSPKLRHTSGEMPDKAIKPEIVKTYFDLSQAGQLKFVVVNSDAAIAELDETTQLFKDHGVDWQVFVMPVGATKEVQESADTAELVVKMINKGYHFAGRLHCNVFGNMVGT